MKNHRVYLGLGGNKFDSPARLKIVKELLNLNDDLKSLRFSNFYRTSPIDVNIEPGNDEWFVNAVCSFETALTLHKVFEITRMIEKCIGKVPKPKNASRPIDLDILFYGSLTYQDSILKIPHEKWQDRLFVLVPLRDLVHEIAVESEGRVTVHNLDFLIRQVMKDSSQLISLLEENSDIQ